MEGYSMIALVGNRIQETAQYSTFKTELSAQNLRRLAFSPDNNAVIAILEQSWITAYSIVFTANYLTIAAVLACWW